MAKSYTFSVSFKKGCYRHIKLSSTATLSILHTAILEAFGLAGGRMHVFFMNNLAWDNTDGYYCTGFSDSKNPATDEVRLCDFKLDTPFIYIYDFGHEKRFTVKLLKVTEEETKNPVLVRSCGEFFLTDRSVKEPDFESAKDKEVSLPDDKESLVLLFASAAANLYGFVSLKTFCKIFGKLTDIHLDLGEARDILSKRTGAEFELLKDFVMFPAGDETSALLENLLSFAHGKPRFVPESKEEFLKYLDVYYIDSPGLAEKIKDYFASLSGNKFEAENLFCDFVQMLKLDYPIESFNEFLVPYEKEADQSYFNLIIESKNASRIWKNKGFTPLEMARLNRAVPNILKNIGRNDACPCGSGKKYKKCCGK